MRIFTLLLLLQVFCPDLQASGSAVPRLFQAADTIHPDNAVLTDSIINEEYAPVDSIDDALITLGDSTTEEPPEQHQDISGHTAFIFPMLLIELPFHLLRKSDSETYKETQGAVPQPPKEKRPLRKTYDPQMPTIWFGSSIMHDGLTGDCHEFQMDGGFRKQREWGITVIEFSKNLYKRAFGLTTALQMYGGNKKHKIDYVGIQVPVLIGYQTPYKIFSVKTGLALGFRSSHHDKDDEEKYDPNLHLNHLSTDWMTVFGLGPLTLTYKQGLLHLYKTSNGRKAFENSLIFGIDLNWLFRLLF